MDVHRTALPVSAQERSEVVGRDAPREHVAERQERASKARRALNDVNVVEGEGGIRRG
jgi:hypothetical protein